MLKEQPVEYLSSEKSWTGDFFEPTRGKRYKIPYNATNHKLYAGCVGRCIDIRLSHFNMAWAQLQFDDEYLQADPDRRKVEWIRTSFLIDA